jgi:hypothetical protein
LTPKGIDLHSRFEMERINHKQASSALGAGTNMAEEYSAACFAPKSALIITSAERICSAERKRVRSAKTAAASLMACRPAGLQHWHAAGSVSGFQQCWQRHKAAICSE